MDTLGAAIGVSLALVLLGSFGGDLRTVVLWSVVPAAAGVAMLALIVEPRGQNPRPTSQPSFSWKGLPPDLKRFLVISGLFTLGNSSNTFLILRAHDLQFTPVAAVALYLVYNLVYASLSYPAGRWSDRVGRKKVLMTGYLTYALVYAGIGMIGGPEESYLLWFLMAGYGVYSALADGVEKALVNDLATPGMRATSLGLHAMIVGIGLFPASALAGQLWEIVSPSAPFFLGGVTGVLAAAGLRGVQARHHR
jgi:MFS family permease